MSSTSLDILNPSNGLNEHTDPFSDESFEDFYSKNTALLEDMKRQCKQMQVNMYIIQLQRLAGSIDLNRDLILEIIARPEAQFWDADQTWDVEAILDEIPLSPDELDGLNETVGQLEGHLLAKIMHVIEEEFKRTGLVKMEDASSVVLSMLSIPSQRKLQRWLEANVGKRSKRTQTMGGGDNKNIRRLSAVPAAHLRNPRDMSYRDLQSECKRRGLPATGKKDELLGRLAVGERALEVDTSPVVSSSIGTIGSAKAKIGGRDPNARFKYRQQAVVFWKAEDDSSPPNDNDYYDVIVRMNKDTKEGTYRVQYKAAGDKKNEYTGEIENNVEEQFLQPVMRKKPMRKRTATMMEGCSQEAGHIGVIDTDDMLMMATPPLITTSSIGGLTADDSGALVADDHQAKRVRQSEPDCASVSDPDSDFDSDNEDGAHPLKFHGNPDALDSCGCRHG
mmetsp:Transcript_11766/g.20681  ORF Transcript_11766/g.20681 Transcript_11766/m.20681 type:complete len:449 (+) Transcript_11766:75-1421(+)